MGSVTDADLDGMHVLRTDMMTPGGEETARLELAEEQRVVFEARYSSRCLQKAERIWNGI